jgi:hypothetical protein
MFAGGAENDKAKGEFFGKYLSPAYFKSTAEELVVVAEEAKKLFPEAKVWGVHGNCWGGKVRFSVFILGEKRV